MIIPYIQPDTSIPAYFHAFKNDAGYDVYTLEDTLIWPFQTKSIPVNIHVNIPKGYCALLTGRSGHSKRGLFAHIGTIDAGYTGLIKAIITNLSLIPKRIKRGERIGQLVFVPIPDVTMVSYPYLPQTERGSRGLGSTGR